MTTPESGEGKTKQQAGMSPEAQRIAVAEACGWRLETRKIPNQACRWIHENGTIATMCGGVYGHGWSDKGEPECLPNYPYDLDACHDMEKVLTEEQRATYASKLALWFKDKSPHGNYFFTDFDLMHSTAAQRCEAFLKTLGLWRES